MNKKPEKLDFFDVAGETIYEFGHKGVLCTVVDNMGKVNVLTLGWGQIGPFYHGNPVMSIAVTPLRYSWRFLEEVPEFVIAVMNDDLKDAVVLCGKKSGRDMDKFEASNMTRVPSVHLRAPSIKEAMYNLECRIYARIHPPHMLLTPEHRKRWPVKDQHTIYFAEVLGIYDHRDR